MSADLESTAGSRAIKPAMGSVSARFTKNYKESQLEVRATCEFQDLTDSSRLAEWLDDAFGLNLAQEIADLKDKRTVLRSDILELQQEMRTLQDELDRLKRRAEAAREWMKQRRLLEDRDLDDIPF